MDQIVNHLDKMSEMSAVSSTPRDHQDKGWAQNPSDAGPQHSQDHRLHALRWKNADRCLSVEDF
jgi:hypothetical protein